MNNLSIYIHIPFCESKCIYCNFVSSVCDESKKAKYFERLCEEISLKSLLFSNYKIVSIYFGGGTPSCVNEIYIEEILNLIKNKYNIANNCEITIECNPNSVNRHKLITYKNAGINRISFGVQSLNNTTLKLLGRLHDKDTAIKAIKLAKEIGFENISCDLLLGLPNFNTDENIKHINELISLGIKHLSLYMLINEPGTLLYKKVKENKIKLPFEDDTINQYNTILSYLENKNFNRYEISNFALPGYECLHNQRYWDLSEYIGFGIAAHSYYNNKRISNNISFIDYSKKFENEVEILDSKEQYEEYIMLGLRTYKGINIDYIKEKFNIDVLKFKEKEIKFLLKNNFIKINNKNISIEKDKFGVANQIILKLI